MRVVAIIILSLCSLSVFANMAHEAQVVESTQGAYIQGELDSISGSISNNAPCAGEACEHAYLSGALHASEVKALSAEFV